MKMLISYIYKKKEMIWVYIKVYIDNSDIFNENKDHYS